MRPLKSYVIYNEGRAERIVKGRVAALKYGYAFTAFKTKLEAEEYAMWWNHDHPRWWTETPAPLLHG